MIEATRLDFGDSRTIHCQNKRRKKSGRSLQIATSEKVAQTNLENVSGLVEQHPMSVIQKK